MARSFATPDDTRLVIDDPAIGELRISGVYKTGDSRSFARAAARMLELKLAEEDERVRIGR